MQIFEPSHPLLGDPCTLILCWFSFVQWPTNMHAYMILEHPYQENRDTEYYLSTLTQYSFGNSHKSILVFRCLVRLPTLFVQVSSLVCYFFALSEAIKIQHIFTRASCAWWSHCLCKSRHFSVDRTLIYKWRRCLCKPGHFSADNNLFFKYRC